MEPCEWNVRGALVEARHAECADVVVRGKHVPLSLKVSVVESFHDTCLPTPDFLSEVNRTTLRTYEACDKSKLSRWCARYGASQEDWRSFVDLAPGSEAATYSKVPAWWRKLLVAEDLAAGKSPNQVRFITEIGRPRLDAKFEAVAEALAFVTDLAKTRLDLKEHVRVSALTVTLRSMIAEENERQAEGGEERLPVLCLDWIRKSQRLH